MAIELTRVEEFALITLNRPAALNALSFALIHDLGKAFDDVAASDARALLITGAGAKAFCAGADVKELTGRSPAARHRRTRMRPKAWTRSSPSASRSSRTSSIERKPCPYLTAWTRRSRKSGKARIRSIGSSSAAA